MTSVTKELHQQWWRQDAEYREAYEALAPEFERIREVVNSNDNEVRRKEVTRKATMHIPHHLDKIAEDYGMDRPVIDALAHIAGLFGARPSARYIVLPYGRSISMPEIAAELNKLYQAGQAGQAAGPTDNERRTDA